MGEKLELNIDPFGPCIYCSDEGRGILASRGISEHMTVFKRQDGHIHVHGPVKNEALIIEMIEAICSQVDIGLSFKEGDEVEKIAEELELSDQGSMNKKVDGSDSDS